MDQFPNLYTNLDDSENYQNNQYFENSSFFPNPSQLPFTQNPQTSQNTEKQPKTTKWETAEDVALMSAWCMASGDSLHGNNKKKTSLWKEIKKMYDAAQAENPEKLGERNVEQMKGRYARLNENAGKWVAAYREAYRRATSGTSLKDIESDAHLIYEKEKGGKKFNDTIVFNEVMCKCPKWALEIPRGTTRCRTEREVDDEESGASTKRTMTSEEGDYFVNSNQESPISGGSSIQRPTGRDEAKKKKGKDKIPNEMVEEFRVMRLTRDSQIDFWKKKLEFDQEKEQMKIQREQIKVQREQKREEREQKKMQLLHLNALLQREHLSPEEEQIKRSLMLKFYGN